MSARRRLALASPPPQAAHGRDLLDLPLREVFARFDAILRRLEAATASPSAVAEPSVWLDSRGAGAYLGGVHERTVRKAAEAGQLRGVRVGGRSTWRFRREWLDAWAEGDVRDHQRRRQAPRCRTRPDSAPATPVCDAAFDTTDAAHPRSERT